MILALDSSTAIAGVALYDPTRESVLEERSWRIGADHSRQLLAEADRALRAQECDRGSLSAVAVALGPGTFNGVRVAVTTAKMLSHVLRLPIVGVNTLELHAAPFRGTGLLVRPLLPAPRGEILTALWRAEATLRRLEEDRIAPSGAVLAPPEETTVYVGEIAETWATIIRGNGGSAVLSAPGAGSRRPGVLAQLAAERLARGPGDDALALAPVYVRPPHITSARR